MKEKRKVSRIQILESFSVFLVIEELGPFRMKVSDLSEIGIGFFLEQDLKPFSKKLEAESELSVQLYLNQTLYLPLLLKVVRVSSVNSQYVVGAEFLTKNKKSTEALKNFTAVLNCLESVAELK